MHNLMRTNLMRTAASIIVVWGSLLSPSQLFPANAAKYSVGATVEVSELLLESNYVRWRPGRITHVSPSQRMPATRCQSFTLAWATEKVGSPHESRRRSVPPMNHDDFAESPIDPSSRVRRAGRSTTFDFSCSVM